VAEGEGKMKRSKVLEERIWRVTVLFKELGYRVTEDERSDESYSASFERDDGVEGGFFIDRESRFVEIGYTFSFSPDVETFVRGRLEEMLKICYEYGCYFSLQRSAEEISFSVFCKLYYTGLGYYPLKDSLRDFDRCVLSLGDLLKIDGGDEEEEAEGKAEEPPQKPS
jgi:hypothetical protein